MDNAGFSLLPPEWHAEIPSTSLRLRELLASRPKLPSGYAIASPRQTRGSGRFGNSWLSSEGGDLALSFLLRGKTDPAKLVSLPMACALAVKDLLGGFGLAAKVKWPNDVMVDNGKIAGILTQCPALPENGVPETAAIVGIGINVNMDQSRAASLNRPVASLFMLTGSVKMVDDVYSLLAPLLEKRIGEWQKGSFAAIREDWLKNCLGVGEKIFVHNGTERLEGTVSGFGENGEALFTPVGGIEIAMGGFAVIEFPANFSEFPPFRDPAIPGKTDSPVLRRH